MNLPTAENLPNHIPPTGDFRHPDIVLSLRTGMVQGQMLWAHRNMTL